MASKNVREITVDNFADTIAEGPVLIDFWAPWCGPCRMQGPILDEVAEHAPAGTVVGKVNVDNEPALAAKFGVRTIPTLVVIADGRIVEHFVGVQTATTLQQALASAAQATHV